MHPSAMNRQSLSGFCFLLGCRYSGRSTASAVEKRYFLLQAYLWYLPEPPYPAPQSLFVESSQDPFYSMPTYLWCWSAPADPGSCESYHQHDEAKKQLWFEGLFWWHLWTAEPWRSASLQKHNENHPLKEPGHDLQNSLGRFLSSDNRSPPYSRAFGRPTWWFLPAASLPSYRFASITRMDPAYPILIFQPGGLSLSLFRKGRSYLFLKVRKWASDIRWHLMPVLIALHM